MNQAVRNRGLARAEAGPYGEPPMRSPTRTSDDRRRLGRSSSLAGVGDGILAVALPLLAAGMTRNPLAVAAVIAAQHAPEAVMATVRPAWASTADQRTMLGLGSTLRAVAVVVVGLVSLVGLETVTLLVLAGLVAGLGAALADHAEEEVAGRLPGGPDAGEGQSGELRSRGMVGMAVVGLPLGGLVYEVGAALPFLVDVGVYALAALGALGMRLPILDSPSGARTRAARRAGLVPKLASGSSTVTLAAFVATAASSAVAGVLVLFAVDDLGLGAPAFGFLLTGLAAAATLGALAAPAVGGALSLRGGAGMSLVASGAGYAAAGLLADPARPYIGILALGVGAGAGMVATVLLRALLHSAVAPEVKDDVRAGFHSRVWTAVSLGALAGGLAASVGGVAPTVTGAGVVVALSAVAAAGSRHK